MLIKDAEPFERFGDGSPVVSGVRTPTKMQPTSDPTLSPVSSKAYSLMKSPPIHTLAPLSPISPYEANYSRRQVTPKETYASPFRSKMSPRILQFQDTTHSFSSPVRTTQSSENGFQLSKKAYQLLLGCNSPSRISKPTSNNATQDTVTISNKALKVLFGENEDFKSLDYSTDFLTGQLQSNEHQRNGGSFNRREVNSAEKETMYNIPSLNAQDGYHENIHNATSSLNRGVYTTQQGEESDKDHHNHQVGIVKKTNSALKSIVSFFSPDQKRKKTTQQQSSSCIDMKSSGIQGSQEGNISSKFPAFGFRKRRSSSVASLNTRQKHIIDFPKVKKGIQKVCDSTALLKKTMVPLKKTHKVKERLRRRSSLKRSLQQSSSDVSLHRAVCIDQRTFAKHSNQDTSSKNSPLSKSSNTSTKDPVPQRNVNNLPKSFIPTLKLPNMTATCNITSNFMGIQHSNTCVENQQFCTNHSESSIFMKDGNGDDDDDDDDDMMLGDGDDILPSSTPFSKDQSQKFSSILSVNTPSFVDRVGLSNDGEGGEEAEEVVTPRTSTVNMMGNPFPTFSTPNFKIPGYEYGTRNGDGHKDVSSFGSGYDLSRLPATPRLVHPKSSSSIHVSRQPLFNKRINDDSVDFKEMLHTEAYRRYFERFSELEHSTENISVWVQIQYKYKRWKNRKQRLSHAKQIYSMYIDPSSCNALNIDSRMIRQIRERIQRAEQGVDEGAGHDHLIDLFDTLQKTIETVMIDTFSRFQLSPLYKEMNQFKNLKTFPIGNQ